MDADVDGTAKRAAAELLQDVHSVTQKFLGYFPKVSANKCTDTSPQEFLCICCGRFSLSLCQTKLPQGSSDTLMAGPSTGKSQGWELSWTAALPSAHTEPAANDGTTAWETHRENCILLCKIHQVMSPVGMGLSGQAVSHSWIGAKILLLKRTVDSVSLLQK